MSSKIATAALLGLALFQPCVQAHPMSSSSTSHEHSVTKTYEASMGYSASKSHETLEHDSTFGAYNPSKGHGSTKDYGHSGSYSATRVHNPSKGYSTDLSFPTQVAQDDNRLLLSNGFPNPNNDAIKDIEKAAGGTLPNGPPGNVTNEDSLTNFKLIAFNELFEVAFFTELLQNITTGVPGYEIPSQFNESFFLDTLIAIQAQEELHALNANGALPTPIQPCAYTFPVTNLMDAITLASTFTDVVLGTLQDIATIFATNDDDAVVRGITSVVGQEGEQEGFYRVLLGKRPSSQPFLTASARDFAFSALQAFVVEGSCPNIDIIPLKIFEPLMLVTKDIPAQDTKITLQFDTGNVDVDVEDLSVVLVNGQNLPVVEKLEGVKREGSVVTFEAEFPFETELLFGLTVVVVVEGDGVGLNSVDDVVGVTAFGPALVEVA